MCIQMTRQREAIRLTKCKLGAKAEVHPARVGAIENRRVVPYDCELRRLADALGWSGEPRDLLAEVD